MNTVTAAKFIYDYKDEILKCNMVHVFSRPKGGIPKIIKTSSSFRKNEMLNLRTLCA